MVGHKIHVIGHKIFAIFSIYFKTNANVNILKFWADMVYEHSMICQGDVLNQLRSQIMYFHNKK